MEYKQCKIKHVSQKYKYKLIKLCQTTYFQMERLQSDHAIFFSNQEPRNQSFSHEASLRDSQMQFISQYLELNLDASKQNEDFGDQINGNAFDSSKQQKKGEAHLETQCATPPQAKKPSIFHNFQKHLITTLKATIKLKSMPHHKKSYLSIVHDIWEFFRESNKASKRFLNCLLGKKKGSNNYFSKVKEKHCDYCSQLKQYLSQYAPEDISAAQDHLCKEIISQSRKILQIKSFKVGRIKHHQDFKLYYQKFVEELQNGYVSARLPKSVKVALIRYEGQRQPLEHNFPLSQ